MTTDFRVTADEFSQSLGTIGEFVSDLDSSSATPSVRVAAVNSGILLIAATFEEFIREMATLSVRHTVKASSALSDVPTRVLRTAWQRTFSSIADLTIAQNTDNKGIMKAVNDAEGRSKTLLAFLRGDITQEIYTGLVDNASAMRVKQINYLFRISNIGNVCHLTSENPRVIDHFNAENPDQGSADLNKFINEFIDQRNEIAHRLNSATSLAPKDVHKYIDTFCVFAHSLCEILEHQHAAQTAGAARAQS